MKSTPTVDSMCAGSLFAGSENRSRNELLPTLCNNKRQPDRSNYKDYSRRPIRIIHVVPTLNRNYASGGSFLSLFHGTPALQCGTGYSAAGRYYSGGATRPIAQQNDLDPVDWRHQRAVVCLCTHSGEACPEYHAPSSTQASTLLGGMAVARYYARHGTAAACTATLRAAPSRVAERWLQNLSAHAEEVALLVDERLHRLRAFG